MTIGATTERQLSDGTTPAALKPLDLAGLMINFGLTMPPEAVLCGGHQAAAEVLAKRPWAERNEELRRMAADLTAETAPEEASSLFTVFRRRPEDGAPCIAPNPLRTMLQETARTVYGNDTQYFSLRRALRFHLRIEPRLIPLLRSGQVLLQPDGIMELPRPIKTPPFERSIVQRPEFVHGPLELHGALHVYTGGAGDTLTPDILRYLMDFAGVQIGLGSHRGLDDTVAGVPGIFTVTTWEVATHKVPAPPKLPETRRGRLATKTDGKEDT